MLTSFLEVFCRHIQQHKYWRYHKMWKSLICICYSSDHIISERLISCFPWIMYLYLFHNFVRQMAFCPKYHLHIRLGLVCFWYSMLLRYPIISWNLLCFFPYIFLFPAVHLESVFCLHVNSSLKSHWHLTCFASGTEDLRLTCHLFSPVLFWRHTLPPRCRTN